MKFWFDLYKLYTRLKFYQITPAFEGWIPTAGALGDFVIISKNTETIKSLMSFEIEF